MGCDIHMYCEVKSKDSKEWQAIGRIFKDSYFNKERPSFLNEDGSCWNESCSYHPYNCRNYKLFAILADVRNSTWSEPIKPISEPKGLPIDVSKFIKKQSEDYGSDGHSHSFITIEELENYDWKQPIKMCAYVSEKVEKEYKEKGIKPTCYAAYSTIGKEMEWEDSYYGDRDFFVDEVIPQLQELKKFGEVRIVFWFDN